MGFMRTLQATWKAATTAEKMNLVLDIICGVGCGVLVHDVDKQLMPGHNRLERICLSTVTTGLGLAAATAASKAIMDNYGNAVANVIDKRKAKGEKTDAE